MKKAFMYTFLVSLTLVTIFYGCTKEKEVKATNEYLLTKLEDASDLTSAKLTYTGAVNYQEGDIPFITQKKYTMVYTCHVDAGIDLSKVKIKRSKNKVYVTLPDVTVSKITVDPESIEFYDECYGLFNGTSKDDTVQAMKLARNDVKNKKEYTDLKKQAKENAKVVIKELLKDSLSSKDKLVIK